MSVTISLDGYSLNVVSIIPDNVRCLLCSNILDNPHQAPCECRFCYGCISNYLENNEGICPGKMEDCMEINLNIERDLRQDILAKRKISRMIVKCPLYSCDQECELRNMKDHIAECITSAIMCGKCNESIKRGDYENHEREECKEGIVICEFCNVGMKRKNLESNHFNFENNSLCCKYNDYCPYKCDEMNKVEWFKHRETCKNIVECPYRRIGCVSDRFAPSMISFHMTNKGYDHAELLLKQLSSTKKDNEKLRNDSNNSYEEMMMIKDRINENESEISNLNNKIISLTSEIEEIKNDYTSSLTMLKSHLQNEISESVEVQSSEIVKINEDIRKVKEEVKIINNQVNNISLAKEEKKKVKDKNFDICRNVYGKEYVFTWNLYNFTKIYNLISPYFYTSTRGYKMSLQFVKNKREECLSFYVWLYAGEFDHELIWPFRKRVYIRILDQIKGNRYYEKSITFNEDAGPICHLNYSSEGTYLFIADFISYETLSQKPYLLQNDELFIQCFVEDLPPR